MSETFPTLASSVYASWDVQGASGGGAKEYQLKISMQHLHQNFQEPGCTELSHTRLCKSQNSSSASNTTHTKSPEPSSAAIQRTYRTKAKTATTNNHPKQHDTLLSGCGPLREVWGNWSAIPFAEMILLWIRFEKNAIPPSLFQNKVSGLRFRASRISIWEWSARTAEVSESHSLCFLSIQ